jgi:hypothetical protein
MAAMVATTREATDIAVAVATTDKIADTWAAILEVVVLALEIVVLAEDSAAVAAANFRVRRRYLNSLKVAPIQCSATFLD